MPTRTKAGHLAYIKTTPGDNEEEVLERISRERFIRLGTVLGVGAACASLVACGGGASNSGEGSGGEVKALRQRTGDLGRREFAASRRVLPRPQRRKIAAALRLGLGAQRRYG